MSTIPIDHLCRDDLVTLLYRVAARLATLPEDLHTPRGLPAGCSERATEPHRGCYWTTMAVLLPLQV